MAKLSTLFVVAFAIGVVAAEEYNHQTCFSTSRGQEYVGNIDQTADGLLCQRWDTDHAPHDISMYSDTRFGDGSRSAAQNFCRNPDNSPDGPWCYTTNTEVRWQYCDVPRCFGWVHSVEPRHIGAGGAVPITLRGVGFATNQFNFGVDSNLGNKVTLVSEEQSLDCEIHKDGTTENMIQCFSPPNMGEGWWRVGLSVDGTDTPIDTGICNGHHTSWSCSIYAYRWYTPFISSVIPRSGPADGFVTLVGKFFTDLYGPNAAVATNGREQKINRIYLTGGTCELKDGDDFHGLQLDSTSSDYGYIKCKIVNLGGPFNTNITVIIDEPFGRTYALPESQHISAGGKVFMYQSYAVVDSISPMVGSNVGGQLLTITGRSFDDTTSPAQIMVGGDECVVETLTSTEITCRTPANPETDREFYPGNRGMKNDRFDTSFEHFDGLRNLVGRDDPVDTFWSDGAFWCENHWEERSECQLDPSLDNYNVRSRGFFVPKQSGDYRFYVRCDDIALFFMRLDSADVNLTKIAECPSYSSRSYHKFEEQESAKYTMEAGSEYFFEILGGEYTSHGEAYIGAAFYQPVLVERIEGKVEPETHSVMIRSAANPEILKIKLENIVERSATKEVQKVTVIDGNNGLGTWRLGLNGVYTDLLDVGISRINLKNALNDLPSLSPDTVTVTEDNGVYTITFNSELGDWPRLTKQQSGGPVVTVADEVDGTASMKEMRLHLEHGGSDLISDVFEPGNLEETIEEAFTSLFSARCPLSIGSGASGRMFYEGYEDRNSPGFFGGTIDVVNEPFCGRSSVMNAGKIFDRGLLDISFNGFICFAYRGTLRNIIKIRVQSESATRNIYPEHIFNSTDVWKYTCINLKEYVDADTRFDGDSSIKIKEFEVYREIYNDIWIDEVVIAATETTPNVDAVVENRRITLPARLDAVDVVYDSQTMEYEATIIPHGCVNEFNMLQVYLAPKRSGNKGAESTSVTWGGDDAWPSDATVTVQRSMFASPPASGRWDLVHNNVTTSYQADTPAMNVQRTLMLEHNLVDVKVTKTDNCYGYTYTLEYTQTSGDLPAVVISNNNLQGDNVTLDLIENDGHVFYDPLPGDMVITSEETPQVQVIINNIHSRCDGDCSYSWSSDFTPSVTDVDPTSGAKDAELTITGTFFSETPAENTVMIGDASCDVTSSTVTEIVCILSGGAQGTNDVLVTVADLGSAEGSVSFQFTGGNIESFSPAMGSTAGGTLLTISGEGFSEGTEVAIDGNECIIQTMSGVEIVCLTPATAAGGYDIEVTPGGGSPFSSTTQFTFDSNDTPMVTSISTTTGSASGGEELVIEGEGFVDAESLTITLGDSIVLIANSTRTNDGEIVTTLPPLAPGTYPLIIEVAEKGYADFITNGVESNIEVVLRIDARSGEIGSFEGGTRLEIAGEGFGDDADNAKVMVGSSECEIDTISDDSIVCYTGPGRTMHTVLNSGIDPVRGLGYAWNPSTIAIQSGDSVRFQWTSPPFVETNLFSIKQTDVNGAVLDEGFDSGDGTPNGYFVHQFHDVGDYYYTSGPMGFSQDIELQGKVIVGENEAFVAEISVMVGGQTAETNANSGVSIADPNCPGTNDAISGCTENAPSPDEFEFVYAICHTPEMRTQDIGQGYIDTDITITGIGFSTTFCDNEVMIGDYTCVVSTQTATELVCAMDIGEEPDVAISYPVTVRVNNLGDSLDLREGDTTYALLPSITGITPSAGSIHGGVNVTISGAGFVGDVTVYFGTDSCEIITQTYAEIICAPVASSAAEHDATVTVTNSYGNLVPVVCINACTFTYDESVTPVLTGIVSPSVITEQTTELTVAGTGFGTELNDVAVMVDDYACDVTEVTDTEFTCDLGPMPAGTYDIILTVAEIGKSNSLSIDAEHTADAISQQSGSLFGGHNVEISGTGFVVNSTTVTINDAECSIYSMSTTMISCTTGRSQAADGAIVVVDVGVGQANSDLTYDYTLDDTPDVTGIDPAAGAEGDDLTISGSGFSSTDSENKVMIGDAMCVVTASSATELSCTAGGSVPGSVTVKVNVDGKGDSGDDVEFTYALSPGEISPDQGSFGGQQAITLAGSGFIDGVILTLCGKDCDLEEVTPTSITFFTPSFEEDFAAGDKECDLNVTIGAEIVTMTRAFTYAVSDTGVISEISPQRGGTQGGTQITISGENFSSDNDNEVTIDGATCDIDSQSAGEIVCTTNAPGRSSKTTVVVKAGNSGVSLEAAADYWYVDVWSSNFTWGGNPPPTEGDFVVVPPGQLLLLDEDTPVLKMLLIQGGELLFDEVDLTLRAENILIVAGGRLTVGTEDAPFQHDATIEMHGQLRAKELPIYGAKCLAVREGELNLHGKPLRMTWTRLSHTASAGDWEIKLEWGQADWPIGGTIAIATTGDRHSQIETEIHTIADISEDGKTITLDQPLEYDHLGVTEDLGGGHLLEMRAEVGLLSRNVRVIGSRDTQWSDEIEACPDGFDTGEFATQTCFQGRAGAEIGSDQFGAQIMFHAPFRDQNIAVGHLSFLEVNYAGQAFKLGRYPIHFHLNGDMTGSYVRGASIHEAFNRAVNVHGSHNVLIEHTVIYNIMGGAFFLEDGIETGNRYYHNLALWVKASSSLLNDDITPAAFWATNPNNTYEHNAVAGGTHFGWWYRLLEHPEGPSATNTICPRRVPLGTCNNNTVHSNGWFGLWTFQDYYPMVGGGCDSNVPEPAVFKKFVVWNCEKGLEFVNGGALQFDECVLANNKLTGVEGKKNMLLGNEVPYTDRAPMIKNSVIAAYAPNYPHDNGGQRFGVILPWSEGYVIKDTVFINFDKPEETVLSMTSIQGTCSVLCGGYNYHLSGISFINGNQHLARFRWPHDGILVDLDGTFSGTANASILPWMDSLDPDKCQRDARFGDQTGEELAPGAICNPPTKFARMAFNGANLASMAYKDVHFTNEFGTHVAKFTDKRLTHPEGWMAVVELGQTYKMVWEGIEHIVNISYNAGFYDLTGGGVVITHNISTKPDKVQVMPGVLLDIEDTSPSRLDPEINVHGDIYFADNEKEFSYLVSDITSRTKRDTETAYVSRATRPETVKCYWPNCDPPPDQNTLPPITSRPYWWVWWSNTTIWPNSNLPSEDDDVVIETLMWVVADIAFPKLGTLTLKGNLELPYEVNPDTSDYRDFTLELNYIIIMGGRLVVGWEDNRYSGNVEIILNGDQYQDAYPQATGTTIGQKAIAVYGGLDLHGKQRSPVQTTLSQTASAGDDTITLTQDIDWQVDEVIVIASTTFNSLEAENVTITGVNGRELTINPPLQYEHLGETMTDSKGKTHSLAAEVLLITRNVVVRGAWHADMEEIGFGGRVLVGAALNEEDGTALTGFARISYTQFVQMGQLGYYDAFDPRYAVSYVQTGPVSTIKPSYLKGNSYHLTYGPAIGIFGAEGMKVQDNVMNRVVGGGMVVYGDGHQIERNTILSNLWTGSYMGRREAKNVAYEACFELADAGDITFEDNIAAGSERAGFRIAGERCGVTSKYMNNKAHSGMFGVMMWEGDEISTDCFQVSGFTAWRNYDFGIFVQTPANSIEFIGNSLIENGVGIWTHTYGPGSLSHINTLKRCTFKDGYVSGATEWFGCDVDTKPDTVSYELSSLARSWRVGRRGLVGISGHNADGGPNGLPTHPFKGRMSYPTINARHDIEGTVFANFKQRTCEDGTIVDDFAIASTPSADDIAHPVYIKTTTLEATVSEENKAFFDRSNVGKINPSDCVDMDCDGHKKFMIEDKDGTFLGEQAGTIIDDASFEWDGDARYGLGDYRIPKVMLTYPNSTRRDPPPNKGIHQGPSCTYMDSWQAFKCFNTRYRMLVIESMDADTEVRRLSPIGLKSRDTDYIDLLNGPQDHGWCAGYTCQKRISTFWAVIAASGTFDIYLTGTNPQHTRFYMIQAEDIDTARLAVYYHSPQRLDVFADDIYIYPTNAEIANDGDYTLQTPSTPDEFLPPLSGSHGQNYFDREWQLQYFILKGTGVVDIIIKEVVVVSLTMPPMTIDDFFGENIVSNLATFLGVPSDKIRIVNIVRETSNRRKRETENVVLDIEIGDPPSADTNVDDVNSGTLNRDVLLNLTRQVVDAVQLGTLGATLNVTLLGIDVQEPLPPPENSTDSDWATLSNASSLAAYIQIPTEMMYSTELVADREQQPFPTQPEFTMYDAAGELVAVLGSRADPWKIQAVLRSGGSDANAVLVGNTICGFKDGVCAFETLGISHSGSGYIIDFEVFDPAAATYSDVSSSISVSGAQLTAGFHSVPDKDMPLMIDEEFTAVVDIRDLSSDMPIEDIEWKDHTWTATLSIYTPGMSPDAVLSGTLESSFNLTAGKAIFDDLSINVRGRYSLKARITSDPADYTLTSRSSVVEVKPNTTMQSEDYSYKFELRLLTDYDTHAAGSEDLVEASVYNYLQSIDDTIRYHDFTISEGSIYVLFWASGENTPLLNLIDSMESSVGGGQGLTLPSGSLTFDTYLFVDDEVVGDLGGSDAMQTTTRETPPNENTMVGIIAGGVVAGVFIVSLLLAVIIIKIKGRGAKTSHGDEQYAGEPTTDSPRGASASSRPQSQAAAAEFVSPA